MFKKVVSIRGATKVLNTKESIQDCVCELCNRIVKENNLSSKKIINIMFTITNDVNVLNPATALRNGNTIIDFSKTPLFCMNECFIENSSELIIRVMFTSYLSILKKTKNIYINGAESLRPDLIKK